jgi:hypothetical protein
LDPELLGIDVQSCHTPIIAAERILGGCE